MDLKNFFLLIALSCCWGPSFLLIKLALKSFPPTFLVFSRVLIGGLILAILLRTKKLSVFNYKEAFKDFFLIGLFANACPFVLISLGETYIPSSLAAIMNSTTPLFTAFIAHFSLKEERLKIHKSIGILLGILGILIIFLPSFENLQLKDLYGCFLVLGGALSYSISFVLSKKRIHQIHPLAFPAGQLLAAALLLSPVGIYQGFQLTSIDPTACFALVGLSILGTALAFVIYHALIRSTGPTFVSFSSLLFPAIGIFLGYFFLNESLPSTAYFGSLIIFLGLLLAYFYEPLRAKLKVQKKPAID